MSFARKAAGLLDGWMSLFVLVAPVLALAVPLILSVAANLGETQNARQRAADYAARLATPLQSDRFAEFRPYITPLDAPEPATAGSEPVQAALAGLAASSGGVLIDLRPAQSKLSAGRLEAVAFRVEIEGDLETVLGSVSAVGRLPVPMSIESLELSALSGAKRPEDRMRLVMLLSSWKEAEP